MSDADLLPPTRLGTSPRERRLRQFASMTTVLVGCALLGAAVWLGSVPAGLGGVLALAAAALARGTDRAEDDAAIRIDARGHVHLCIGAAPEQAATVSLLAPWLIVLRSGRRLVALWPDRLPADRFRRASAVLRWTPPRSAPSLDPDR